MGLFFRWIPCQVQLLPVGEVVDLDLCHTLLPMTSFARAPRASSPASWVSSPSCPTSSQYFIPNGGDTSFAGITAMPSQYFISNYDDPSISGRAKMSLPPISAMSSEYCLSNTDLSTSGTQMTPTTTTDTVMASHYAQTSEKSALVSDSVVTVSMMPSKYCLSEPSEASLSISDASTHLPSSFYGSMSELTLLSDTEAEDVQSVIKRLEQIDYDSRISTPSVSDGEDDNPCPHGCNVQSKLDYLNMVGGDVSKAKAHRKFQAERVLIAPRIQKVECVRATRGWSGICKFQPRERRGFAKLVRYYPAVDFKPPEFQRMLVLDDPDPNMDSNAVDRGSNVK